MAAFFSGGVDSWSTILTHPEITDLTFVRGTDLLPGSPNQALLWAMLGMAGRDAAIAGYGRLFACSPA